MREFHRWTPAAWLRVTGEDALSFLQGQCTNDLRNLMTEGAVYGLWLNQKGKVLADSFVVGGTASGAIWLASYFSAAEVIRERLEAYIIADDVQIEDGVADWRAVTLFGEVDRDELMRAVPGGLAFAGRRDATPHMEWVFPVVAEEAVSALLAGARELTRAELELRRVRAGIPAVPVDIGSGELPQEGGLEAEAISYTKGCYLGQEVMARLRSMGQVRRQLRRVRGAGTMPPLPAALFQGERRVGELRSVVEADGGFAGLALLSLLHLQPEAGLSLEPASAPVITGVDRA